MPCGLCAAMMKHGYFYGHFSEGSTLEEAMHLHEGRLAVECPEHRVQLSSGASNPKARTVYNLYQKWQQEHHGTVVEPFTNLWEKVSQYLEQGKCLLKARIGSVHQ